MSRLELNSWRPKLADSVILLERENAFCFFRPEIPDWLVGNQNAAAILSRCNGSMTASDLAHLVSGEHNGINPEEVLDFLTTLRSENALFADQIPEPEACRPYPLRSVHLNLTSACNLRCVYCYADDRENKPNHLTKLEHFDLLAELTQLGTTVVTLTGGEPTLHPEWLSIAHKAKKSGHSLMLLTNAAAIAPDEIAQAASLFDLIKVSIDGSTENVHDRLRGEGSFSRAMAAVEALSAKGASVILSMTVTRQNIDDIPNAAARYGSMLSFAPLFRAGRAKFRPDLDITGDEYYEALVNAPGVNPMSTLCSVLASARKKPIRKCAIGDGEISIGSDGTVYPCHMLHYPQFAAGNVRDKPLADLLEAPSMRLCKDLIVDNLEECRICEVRYLCGGACRARAFHATGCIDAADEFCSYEYRAFLEGIFRAYRL